MAYTPALDQLGSAKTNAGKIGVGLGAGVGLAAGGAQGAAKGAMLGAKVGDAAAPFVAELTPAAREQRRLLKEGIAKMNSGQSLGYSEAQKAQALVNTQRAYMQQNMAAQADLDRQAAAARGGGGNLGDNFAAQQALQAGAQAAQAAQAAATEQVSSNLAQEREGQLRAEIAEGADRGRSFWAADNTPKGAPAGAGGAPPEAPPTLDWDAIESGYGAKNAQKITNKAAVPVNPLNMPA